MLDSALEPSYNLFKNHLLLPWILKLIVDMINDSETLLSGQKKVRTTKNFINEKMTGRVDIPWRISESENSAKSEGFL